MLLQVLILLGYDLWQVEIDLESHSFKDPLKLPTEYPVTAEEKENTIRIVEAQSEVQELLEEGAQIIYVTGGTSYRQEKVSRTASAIVHLDGSF